MKIRLLLAPLCAFALFATSARAVTLYHDNFDGSASSQLLGTTPDVTTNSATWSGASGFMADGAGSSGAAYLPLSFSTFTSYEITVTFDLVANSGSTSWVALSLATSNTNPASFNNNGAANFFTQFVRQNGAANSYAGSGTNNAYTALSTGAITVGNGMKLITKIDVGASKTSATISMSIIGSDGATTVMASNKTGDVTSLAYFNISSVTSNYTLQDLLVTSVASPVPEPSTTVLLIGVSALAFVGMRRRRGA